MAEQLASVPDETTTGFPAAYPPSNSYSVEFMRSMDAECRSRQPMIMLDQLASVPEETTTGFPAAYPPSNSYSVEFMRSMDAECRSRQPMIMLDQLAAVPEKTTTGFPAAYPPSNSYSVEFMRSMDAECRSRQPMIMLDQLAAVPEETTTGFPAPYPPSGSYRDSIRSVEAPQWRTRSTLFPQSGNSGSSYSSTYSGGSSYTNISNISGCSSGLVSAGASDNAVLTKIAQKMVSDSYIQKMVQAFSGQNPDRVLEAWFVELDVPWVLQSRDSHGSLFQLQPQELVERWIRSLTIIAASIRELVDADQVTPAVARFGKASISAMLDFVHIFNLSVAEKLQAILRMYICVSTASYNMNMQLLFSASEEAQSIFNEICNLLKRKESKLIEAISGMITEAKVKALSNVDDSWDIEILRGRGEVHRSVRLLMDCIVVMRKAHASSQDSAQSHNTLKLRDLIDDTMGSLKNMLQEKSELCLDPSLRYIFLLNNSNFVAMSEPPISLGAELLSLHHQGLELTRECEKHMDSYLEISWGHVLSCISTSKISGPLRRWNITSSLARFQSAFHKTYQAQKFWKVPDPCLRSLLREKITRRVISAYRDYLKEHPELEKKVSDESSNPDLLAEMVGELFEG